ncbi:Anucleate primary sterigmata B protein [Rutstroemia sp. NJR-2017a WRK4]|nr:Anucleate primary sterigmata B protein [Rutstroemia sp. NJR-2017a WRK4]
MAEGEDNTLSTMSTVSTTDSRPRTARRDSDIESEQFTFHNFHDLASNGSQNDDSISFNAHLEQNNHLDPLHPANLPSLAPPSDSSSVLYPHSDIDDNRSESVLSLVDEKAMRRHLDNVESSFMPAVSPIGLRGKTGEDDTYLFDSGRDDADDEDTPAKETQTPRKPAGPKKEQEFGSPPTPDGAYKTPGPPQARYAVNVENEDSGHSGEDNTSALETLSSSPTAAAAARTISRAMSMASVNDYETASQSRAGTDEDQDATPTRSSQNLRAFVESTEDQSKLHRESSNRSLTQNHLTVDAGATPGSTLSNGRRPKFLRSRHSSQTSSISSFITNPDHADDRSDITLGADYALQTGGAAPPRGLSRNASMTLSRTMSLGSMASGIDESLDSAGRVEGPLATLAEEDLSRLDRKSEDPAPETPRAVGRPLDAPTDTVIARHVRNVHVPESIAKELRNKNTVHSPSKSASFAASALGPRNAKNLTLKEQSSTIERLSKENFDLKLKVMFLSDRLDKVSEEGVKEMISENVELKTGLAVMQRDNKALKKRIKELEKQLKEDEDRPSTARSGTSSQASPRWYQEGAFEREEELLYLREKVEEYVTEIEKLRNDSIARENEKRNLAELVRTMGERRGQNIETREEMDVWKDLLEQETARREQSDDENKKLREEIFRLRSEATAGGHGLNHTTNIYNITKKNRQISPSRPKSELSDQTEDRNGAYSSASTLVEEIRRDNEQLRHENAELRREVGAQTSMLTSRNREKERLYQEIEDLKLGQRRGTSVAGESIFERSASRAHERSLSRTSAGTRQTNMNEADREEFENKQAELRDRINALKIHNQDLQRELDSCMEDFETAVEQKKEAEALAQELQEALDMAEADLLTMQADRDEALHGQEEAELMFESLRKEAQEELDGFATEAEEANAEIERLQNELAVTTDNFHSLQAEMREMSDSVVRLEDDHEQKTKRVQELEKDLDEANHELEEIEKNYVDANEKVNRLNVQQESSQNEIAFLREEQDGDKIKIGDLEAAIRNLEQGLHEEQERSRELEERLAEERHQREVVASREKQEVQQFVNDLNREASTAKDEARKLRKNLTSREVEAAEWKQRLMELENNLREALGDLNGTRSSLLNSIAKLQRELENTIRELDTTKASLAEKERMIKQRDSLLESHALESRKLADMLDKERQTHRVTKHQYETFQKTNSHTTRTLSQQESRVLELETSRQQDRRKIAQLESNFKEQLTERNNLLLALWNRLAALCGTDWTHNNSLINGRALPSLEAVSTMLPGFSKNLLAAVKTIETLVGDFRGRVKDLDRRLWKEYQNLENRYEVQSKKLDRLETMARSAIPFSNVDSRAEIVKLKDLNRNLKAEISTLRAGNDVRNNAYETSTSPSPSVPTGPRRKIDNSHSRASTMTRHSSASAVETVNRSTGESSSRSGSRQALSRAETMMNVPVSSVAEEDYKPDLRWQVRLQELEYKLKAEREARKLDRSSAAQRLREKDRENAELVAEVERGRVRGEMEGGRGT